MSTCKSILVIEDDAAIRQTMKDVLEIQGYSVKTAINGIDGAAQLRELNPLPCAILLDLMMPASNGWQFLDYQRSSPELRKIPVIVCSAYEESAKAIHPSAFVSKPVQLDQLLRAVQAFCL